MARLSTTYRSNRRLVGAVAMPPRIIGENTDRLGHKYRIYGAWRWTAEKPPINGARECARRRRQRGFASSPGPSSSLIDGDYYVKRTEESRPLAVESETHIAGVEVGLGVETISRQPDQRGTRSRKPLTQEQKDKKNEQERARRAAVKAQESAA